MRHAILGAGAIGGLLSTALASIGEDVIIVVKPERVALYPEQLTLQRPSGTITAPARAVSTLKQRVDVLWIATKAFQLEPALRTIDSVPGMVIPLLNGVDHMEILRARFGNGRVVPGTIAIEAERLEPGVFVQRGATVRLNLGSATQAVLGPICAKLSDLGFQCQFMANEQTLLWSKLCFLGPFALVTSASGKNKGDVLADAHWRGKLDAAVDEACAVGKALGADVDPGRIRSLFDNAPSSMRSSMQKDVEAGRPLELDAIGGAIVRGGERKGIDVPATRWLMSQIEHIASAKSS